MAEGSFREDLLFRLNVLTLPLPPLRERPGDIEALARHFAAKLAQANGLPHRPLSAAALTRLKALPWRGNVRELENCVHRAVVLAQGTTIETGDIEPTARPHARRAVGRRARPGRPHHGRGRAAADRRHAAPHAGQPDPCGHHPRHLDPHPAQQAARIWRRRHHGAAADWPAERAA